MAPRKKVKANTVQAISDAASTTNKDAVPSNSPSANAIAKPRRRVVRGHLGGLKDMPSMPLDILIEIMGLLTPKDLLNLARTSKNFRAFLLDRKFEHVWKAARSQVPGLPDRPPYFSEPAYANLMFFDNCYNCGKSNVQHVYWEFGVRYCNEKCGGQIVVARNLPGAVVIAENIAYLQRLYDPVVSQSPSRRSSNRPVRFKPEVDAFREKWMSLTDDAERLQFIKECQEKTSERRKHTFLLQHWADYCKGQKELDNDRMKQERFNAVKERIRQEGWGKELDSMSGYEISRICVLPAVDKTTKLTNQAWGAMRESVMKIVLEHRDKMLAKERRKAIIVRLQVMREAIAAHHEALGRNKRPRTKEDDRQPRPGDLAYLSEFHKIISTDPEVPLTKESFSSALESLADIIERWTEKQRERYEARALHGLRRTPAAESENLFELAVCTFSCTRGCRDGWLRWPDLLGHPCFRPRFGRYAESMKDDFDSAAHTACDRELFYGHNPDVVFNPHLGMTRCVIRACGEDPDTVTWDAMQASSARLRCTKCSHAHSCEVYDWLSAMSHYRDYHPGTPRAEKDGLWAPLGKEEAAQATALAETLFDAWSGPKAYTRDYEHYIACAWCTEEPSQIMRHIVDHFPKCHGREPVYGVDVYITDDMRTRRDRPKVTMCSSAIAHVAWVKKSIKEGTAFLAPPEAFSSNATVEDPGAPKAT
ncbi:hypothetical protein C8Q79DRAFT_965195 [Trametes meyenii]|nr:hypothetical protein C8Q79DRAFT_965195 [Trametes meyenii]